MYSETCESQESDKKSELRLPDSDLMIRFSENECASVSKDEALEYFYSSVSLTETDVKQEGLTHLEDLLRDGPLKENYQNGELVLLESDGSDSEHGCSQMLLMSEDSVKSKVSNLKTDQLTVLKDGRVRCTEGDMQTAPELDYKGRDDMSVTLDDKIVIDVNLMPMTCDICKLIFSPRIRNFHRVQNSSSWWNEIVCCDRCQLECKAFDFESYNEERFSLRCMFCSKGYMLWGNVKAHEQGGLCKGRPFICDICFSCFNEVSSLLKHKINAHTVKPSRRPRVLSKAKLFPVTVVRKAEPKVNVWYEECQCPLCGEWFFNKYSFRRHRMRHSGERPLQCSVCSKRFYRKDNLVSHEKKVHHYFADALRTLEAKEKENNAKPNIGTANQMPLCSSQYKVRHKLQRGTLT